MMNNIDFKIKNLAEVFNGEIIGDKKLKIKGLSSIENASMGDITFINNEKYLEHAKSTKASAIIIDNKSHISINKNKTKHPKDLESFIDKTKKDQENI